MSVFVFEHYRPIKENDQMLMSVDNINYVKSNVHDLKWLEERVFEYRNDEDRNKIIVQKLDMTELVDIINDFIHHGHLVQPCNISVYAMRVINIGMLNIVIRDILERNLIRVQP